MKNMIIVCSIISFLGTVIRLIFISAKKEKYVYAINTVIGFIVLSVVFHSLSGYDFPKLEYNTISDINYKEISEKEFDELLISSQSEIEKKISEEIYTEFGISPYKCSVLINKESLSVEKAEITFKENDVLISNYEIATFIENKFNMKAVVKFI